MRPVLLFVLNLCSCWPYLLKYFHVPPMGLNWQFEKNTPLGRDLLLKGLKQGGDPVKG